MSAKAKGTKTYDTNGMSKIVEQYSLDNELIATYQSLRQAGEAINKNFKSISTCCRGITKTAYGFKWRYVGTSYKPIIKAESPSRRKKVYQYSLDGEYIGEYESASKAEQILKIGHISCACLGKLNFTGGFQWRYEKFSCLEKLTFNKTHNLNRYK